MTKEKAPQHPPDETEALRKSYRKMRALIYRHFWMYAIAVATVANALLFLILVYAKIDLAKNLTVFITAPGFVIAVLQLARAFSLDRATFIKDYATGFVTDPYLYTAYHRLIYSYDKTAYQEIKKETDLRLPSPKALEDCRKPYFVLEESLNKDRPAGSRFFDPRTFQFSEEERQLDALLTYFDVIASYHSRGFIRLEDIVNSMGLYLSYVRRSDAVQDYLDELAVKWRGLPAGKARNAPIPFTSLRELQDALID